MSQKVFPTPFPHSLNYTGSFHRGPVYILGDCNVQGSFGVQIGVILQIRQNPDLRDFIAKAK